MSVWPMTKSPIADGEAANAASWWMRLLRHVAAFLDGLDDTDWTTPTLGSAWVYYGAPYAVPGYKLMHGNEVWLQGLIKNGTLGNLFTLPTGYRPGSHKIFTVLAHGTDEGIARIDITSDGVVALNNFGLGGGNDYMSLTGISFTVD
jgi:hypothetical protein